MKIESKANFINPKHINTSEVFNLYINKHKYGFCNINRYRYRIFKKNARLLFLQIKQNTMFNINLQNTMLNVNWNRPPVKTTISIHMSIHMRHMSKFICSHIRRSLDEIELNIDCLMNNLSAFHNYFPKS